MNNTAHRALELGKSILILLLTLSALLLAAKAFWYSDANQGGLLNRLLPSVNTQEPLPSNTLGQGGVHRPVRMAVVNGNGRYGVQYDDATVDQLFQHLGGLLGEALSTAQSPSATTRHAWEEHLTRVGVYFDFPGVTPLSLLSAWLGGGEANPTLGGESSRILLAHNPDGTEVSLLYVDAQTGSYYACKTAAQFGSLLDGYVPNGAAFAFQHPDRYADLAPDVMLLPDPPAPPIYLGSNAVDLSDTAVRDRLLNALGFLPQSQSIYPAADGWSVRDGSDILRLTAAGAITYHTGEGDARYPVSVNATQAELMETVGHLVEQFLVPLCGSARIYLSSFTQEEGVSTLTYSYLLSGANVYLGNRGRCASVTVSGGRITDYDLQLRNYAPSAETAVLLPEFQASAAMEALDAGNRNLILYYYDSGNGLVAPAWTAR